MRQYEGMFLFDAATVTSEAEAKEEVKRLFERCDAEIIVCRKWEERRLAYQIQDCKRGLYLLAYFRVAPDRVMGLEKDARLSEKVLRMLVLRADWMTEELMHEILAEPVQAPAPTPTGVGEAARAPAATGASTSTESAGRPTSDGDAKASASESPDKSTTVAETVTSSPESVEAKATPVSSAGDVAVETTPDKTETTSTE